MLERNQVSKHLRNKTTYIYHCVVVRLFVVFSHSWWVVQDGWLAVNINILRDDADSLKHNSHLLGNKINIILGILQSAFNNIAALKLSSLPMQNEIFYIYSSFIKEYENKLYTNML